MIKRTKGPYGTTLYLAVNTMLFGSLYFAVMGNENLQSIVLVVAWILILIAPLMLIPDVIEQVAKEGRLPSVPRWVDILLDLVILVSMAWMGWVITSIFFMFQILATAVFWTAVDSKIDELNAAEEIEDE